MEDDRSFYERRLREELARARDDGDAGLRALHRRWAGLYRQRLARLPSRREPDDSPSTTRGGTGPRPAPQPHA